MATNYFLENKYESLLNFALKGKRPYLFVASTFGLLILAGFLMSIFPPKTLFFPNTQAKQVFVFLEYPIGTDIEQTNTISKWCYTKQSKNHNRFCKIPR